MDDMTDEQIDALMRHQIRRLDMAFNDFIAIATEKTQRLYYNQVELNAALRAQTQCRATAHTLKQWQKLSSPPAQS